MITIELLNNNNIIDLSHTDNISNGYGDLSIDQGVDYNKITLKLNGDYSEWQPFGSIRDKYYDDDVNISNNTVVKNEPLAIFYFSLNSYDGVKFTSLMPYLTASQTALIPYTVNRVNNKILAVPGLNINGGNVFVYDINMQSPQGNIIRIVKGWVEVTPRVSSSNIII